MAPQVQIGRISHKDAYDRTLAAYAVSTVFAITAALLIAYALQVATDVAAGALLVVSIGNIRIDQHRAKLPGIHRLRGTRLSLFVGQHWHAQLTKHGQFQFDQSRGSFSLVSPGGRSADQD